MKNNKSKKIFIIIIIVLALILLVGVAFAFMTTSKSDKELFFEYASQIFDTDNGFIDNKLVQYNEKKNSTVYDNEGSFTAKVNSESLDEKTKASIDKFSISFKGNTDRLNNKSEELVKINYSENVNFPVLYKKVNGMIGIKFSEISKRFFALNENEISEFIKKITGTDNTQYSIKNQSQTLTSTPSKVDLSSIQFTTEELNKLKDNYLKAVQDVFDDSNFTRVTSMESEGYTLELSNQKFKEVVIKVLQTLKNDEVMLDKITKVSGQEYTPSDIDKLVIQLEQTQINEGKAVITVYETDKKLSKIEIQFNDEFKLTILKNSNEDEVSYNIDMENKEASAGLCLSYAGLKNLEQIQENIGVSLNLGTTGRYNYNIDNKVNFLNAGVAIENFAEGEYVDINKLNTLQLNQVLTALTSGITKVNENKLKQANLEAQNPLLSIIPNIGENITNQNTTNTTNTVSNNNTTNTTNTVSNNNTTNTTNTVSDNNTLNTTNTVNTTTNTTANTNTSSSSSLVSGMEELSKESFNAKFTQYEGDSVRGATVKSLIMQIIANNMVDEQRKIEVTGDVKLTKNEVPDSVKTSKNYKVTCSTGKDGYINKVEILEKK